MFARLSINIPALSGVFDYSIPEHLLGQVRPGCLVAAPFGGQTVQGVILDLIDSPAVESPKAILDLLDAEPVLTQPQLALAREMAESTLNPLSAIVALMLPAGLSQQADVLYELRRADDQDKSSPVASRLIQLLRARKSLRGRQIDAHFANVDWRKTANMLLKKGVISARNVLPPPRVRPKFVRVAQLSVSPEAAEAEMESLGTKQTLARRQSALRFLIHQPEPVNLSWVYASTGCNLADLQELEERGLIRLFENEIFRDPLERRAAMAGAEAVNLTQPQIAALNAITDALRFESSTFLLHGITGSGKTEVYLRAVEETVRLGRRAIVLVPEIALTPQIVRRFSSRFAGQVGLLHSKLSEGERYDTWRRARAGRLNVIIGARSALFAPLMEIGLIIVDECHDASYYQAEMPYYHAARAAQEYAKLCGAVCVLGSATPTVEQRYAIEHGAGAKLDLPQRVTESALPPVQVVDMRGELKDGNHGIFSHALAEALAETISRGEQAILFLNRRGTASHVFCRDCGHVMKCPNCETPLTLHVENKVRLLCHHCGYARQRPKICPNCTSGQIREYGLGSEKVEAEVKEMFPSARTLRWDWDTTRSKDSHEIILTHFANHQADVLVGTQMLAKGLDLPLVTLVGIVLADVGLNLPDPFAGERVFHTLTQVAGRAGRSARGGKVILQTFMPEHDAIQYASRHDVNGFYENELNHRKQLGYPPFARLLRLEYRHADDVAAQEEAQSLAARLKSRIEAEGFSQTEMIGPVPPFFMRQNREFRWQIVLRGPNPTEVIRGLHLRGWRIEADPINLL